MVLIVPWATNAQDCTQTITQSQPYIQDFEGVTGTTYSTAGSLPNCWNGYYNGTTAAYVPHVVGSGTYWYTHSGTNALGLTSGSSTSYGNTKYVLMPPVNVPLNQLELSFWMCTESSSSGTLYVGYVTSDDTSTFTSLHAYPASTATIHSGTGLQASAGVTYTLTLGNVPANATRIAFKWYHNSTYYSCFIDDVVLGYAPTCPAVDNISIAPTNNSATVSWSEMGTATNWELIVNDSSDVAFSQIVSSNPYTVTGLNANSSYTLSIRAICGAGDTSYARGSTFRTLCEPIATNSLPFTYGFEDATANGSSGNFNVCFGRHTSTTTNYPYPSTSQKHTGTYGCYFYSTSSVFSYLTLPPFEENIEDLYLTFWAYKTSANYGHVYIGVMSDPNDLSTFDTLATYQVSAVSTWEYFEVPLSSYSGNGGVLTFLSPNLSAASYLYLDDITVSLPPTCPLPVNITASNATANTVDVSWISPANSFIVEYGPNGISAGDGDTVIVNTNTVTLSGLSMGTIYSVFVTGICDDGVSFPAMGTVTTGCATITSDDLPYMETFESYGSGSSYSINTCWTKGTNGSTAYPYPYSTNAINGSRSLYFYGYQPSSASTTPIYSWVALPPVDDDVSMSDLQLNFSMRRHATASYTSLLCVGIADSVNGLTSRGMLDTTVTWIDTIDLFNTSAGSIHEVDVSFDSYEGNGKYVVIYAPIPTLQGTSTFLYNYSYVDDIVLRNIPSCFWPTEVSLSSVGSDECEVVWVPDPRTPNPNSWTIEYGEVGFTADEANVETVYDTFYLLSNLLPNTDYEVHVSANCNGDMSDPAIFTFRTLCDPIDTLPYIQDFETAPTGTSTTTDFVNCLFRHNNGTTYFGYPYISSSSSYNHTPSGTKALYWYNSSTVGSYGDYEIVVLPSFNTEVMPINMAQISFWAKLSTATYTPVFQIGTMTDPTNVNTFELYESVNLQTGNTDWHKYTVMLDNYHGNATCIAIKTLRPTSTWTVYIDDIELNYVPNCRPSTDLSLDSLSYDAAVLSWRNSSESANSYTVYYSTQPDFSIDTCNTYVTVYDTFAVLTGLTSFTNYYWTVVADCGSEYSSLPEMQSFFTPLDCGPGYINILDTLGTGTSSSYTYFAYNYNSYPYGYTACIFTAEELAETGLVAGANINSISVHAGATACTIPDLKVYMAETTLGGFSGASDTNIINSLNPTLVYNSSLTTTASQWVDIPLATPFNYTGSANLLVFIERTAAPSASGNFYYGSTSPDYLSLYGYRSSATANRTATRALQRVNMAFNMCAELPECARPTDVAITSLGDTSVSLAWNSDNNSFEYLIGPFGFDPDAATTTPVAVTTNSVSIFTLNPNTSYDFYVRTVCSSSEISDWSIVTSFTTACSAMPLPYSENFENYPSGSANSINPCWTKGTSSSTAYPYPYATNAISGGISLYFYGYQPSSASTTPIYSYAAMPMFAAPVNTLQVSFKMRRHATTTDYYTSRLLVGVMTDPYDISTFEGIDTIDLKNEPSLSIHQFEVNFDSYTGTGKYIAFYDAVPPLYGNSNYTYSYVYLDDITVDLIPNCPRILDITVDGTTENSATFHWVNRSSNNGSYTIEYGPEGFIPGNGTQLTTVDTFITITGLTASTGYDFYVRPSCSSTEDGPWSFPVNFRTVCGTYPVPFVEDFESYGSGASFTIDPCWFKGTSSSTAYPYPYSTNAVTGSRSLYFYGYQPSSASTTPIYSYVALPEFVYGVDSLELSFKVRRYSTTTDYYTTRLLVGVMSDPDDISTFVGIDTIDLKNEAGGSIHEVVVDFSGYTGTGKHIAIYDAVPPLYGTSTYSYSYAYVDDISVNLGSLCGRPFNLQGVVNSTTVDLSWTDTIGATQWQIEYGPEGFELGTGTIVVTGSNPHTVTGLTPSTSYDFYVSSFCPGGALGGTNNGIYTFTTSQIPAAVPYFYDFESATEWANWQSVSNNLVGWYRGTAEAAEGQYGLYVSADGGQTCNSLHSVITNAAVYRDIDFGPTPGSYEVSFLAKSAGVNDGNYEGINVMLVDPATDVTPSSTSLTSPWGTFNTVHVVRDTTWERHVVLFDNISGVQRLAFNWYTSTTATHPVWNGAGAIDSLVVVPQSCVRPSSATINDVGADYVTLSWDGDPLETYQVRLQPTAGGAYTYATFTNNHGTVYGLNSSTAYYAWVFHVCGPNNVSYSSPRVEFRTTCEPFIAFDTLYEDFDSYTGTAYNAAGVLPDCWEAWGNGTTSNYLPHVTDGNTYSYSVTGKPVTMTSGSAVYGDTKILRLPKFAEPVSTLTLSYWFCTESSANGVLSVGYMTGFDYENDFVPVVSHSASTSTYHSGNGVQTDRGVFDTVTFDSVPSSALFIAFRWVYNSSFYSVCIDNVQVTSSGNYCHTPQTVVSNVDYSSATVHMSTPAQRYDVGVKQGTDASFDDDANVVLYGDTYTFTGLMPNTLYRYRVRAWCDTVENMYSEWVEGTFVTSDLPCTAPANLHTESISYTSATLAWDADSMQNQWIIRVWDSGTDFDQEFEANVNPFTVTGLPYQGEFFATVRASCGGGLLESEDSDTISFTTANCEAPTSVNVMDVTAHTALVYWSGYAPNYRVEYGPRNFSTGTGTEIEVAGTSITISGLVEESDYDVYVYANCEDGVVSPASQPARFTTPRAEGITTVGDGMSLSIYPNPATSSATITLSGVNGEVRVTVVDMNGRVVMSDSMSCEGDCAKKMEVEDLAQGAYFVRIEGDNLNMVKKLIVK